MKTLTLLLLISTYAFCQTPGAGVTDIDGNYYPTVIIGTQEWMATNLRTTKYANGNPIPNVTDGTTWSTLTTGAWCYYNNIQNIYPYGKLYNGWVASDSRNVCPAGWHVPSDNEFMVLSDFLGGFSVAGGKMKINDSQYWYSPNTGATNESGFSGVAGGTRGSTGQFGYLNLAGLWWGSTADNFSVFHASLSCSNANLNLGSWNKKEGLSIRCLKGAAPVGLIELKPEHKELVKIIDLMGRETTFKANEVQIYMYSDGSTEKVCVME